MSVCKMQYTIFKKICETSEFTFTFKLGIIQYLNHFLNNKFWRSISHLPSHT